MDGKSMPLQMLLMRSAHLLKYQTISLVERFDMNLGQAAILFILSRYGNLTQRQLSGRAGITPPSMNVALRKMEEKGLVNDQPGQGKLDIFTTGSTEEYTMKAAKVGLDPVTSVQFYPPMKL